MFESWQMQRVFRKYREVLGPRLAQHHGGHRVFTPNEVYAGLLRWNLSMDYADYAYALYCTEEAFNAYQASNGMHRNYDELRKEIVPRMRYASSNHDSGSTGDGGYWGDSSCISDGDSGGDCGSSD